MADTVDVDIESVNMDGDGVARLDEQPVTVPFTIPGERVRVRLGAPRRGAMSAELREVIRASPHRVNPGCRHFGPDADGGHTCGGCAWQHIAYPEQLRLKTDLVTRVVRASVRSAPAARPMLAPTPDDTPWRYRHKVHFAASTTMSGAIAIGHYARFSRRLVPVRECPVHDERGNRVAMALRDACQQAGVRSLESIAVRAGWATSEIMATLVVSDEGDKRVRVAARRALEGPSAPMSLHVNVHARGDAFIFGPHTRHIAGPGRLREEVGGVSFLVSPTAFFQTNVQAAQILVQQVLAAVPVGARVLDLYAGAGLFALPLAKRGHRVVAVEENRAAVADGEASLDLNRLPAERCRFVAMPVESALRSRRLASRQFDTVVLDPPREGCAASVIEGVCGSYRPATAVYVSCDPSSLARDLARVVQHDYVIASMQPVDMFPHTPHIETVVLLTRSNDRSAQGRRLRR